MTAGEERLSLERSSASPALARAHVDRRLDAAPEVRDDVRLVVTELVTNAVLHGEEPIVLAVLDRTDRVRVEVCDGSPVLPHQRDYRTSAQSGRGLVLIAAVALGWGASRTGAGKVVWAEVDKARTPGRPAPAPAIDTEGAGGWLAGAVPVVFTAVPTMDYLRMQEHQDALLREAELVAVSAAFPEPGGSAPPAHVVALLARVQRALAHPSELLREAVRVALARGEARVDITVPVTPAAAEVLRETAQLLDAVDELARGGQLLLEPADEATVRLRHWFVDELTDQLRRGSA